MKTGNWTLTFFNPGMRPEGEFLFGCGTNGWIDPDGARDLSSRELAVWKEAIPGTVVCGDFESCLGELSAWQGSADLAIILLSRGQGAEEFLDRFREILPETRIAGGVSASLPGESGELLPENGDVSVLLCDGWQPFARNILQDTGRRFAIRTGDNPREIAAIRTGGGGLSALADWRELQLEYSVPYENFECLTLSNPDGVNIHMHTEDKRLIAGANCHDDLKYSLRFASHAEIDDGAQEFVLRRNLLYFGCAGLKGAMRRLPRVGEGSLAVFLFGEIAQGQFGNLMMTGIAKA